MWVAEHHLSGFGIVSAPSVYLAAIAGRTRRIDLGYAVAVVPLHQPVRLAEEIAWLGHLSGGRLLVGVGPGFRAGEFAGYGVALEERHARLEEGLAIVRGLLGNETFAHRGRYWEVPAATLRPRPFGGEAPPFLRACSSPESLRRAAEAGEGVLLGTRPVAELAETIDLYRSIRAAAGAAPRAVEREVARFRVLRRVVVAANGDEARAEALRALEVEEESARGGRADGVRSASSAAGSAGPIPGGCVGSPREVREDIAALEALGVRHVISWPGFGNLPYPVVRRSIELLATDVLPFLRGAGDDARAGEREAVSR